MNKLGRVIGSMSAMREGNIFMSMTIYLSINFMTFLDNF